MGGISGEIASIVLFFNPIPLLPSPLKGEERSYLAFMRLPWRRICGSDLRRYVCYGYQLAVLGDELLRALFLRRRDSMRAVDAKS